MKLNSNKSTRNANLVCAALVTTLATINLVVEFFQMITQRADYWTDWVNYNELALNSLTVAYGTMRLMGHVNHSFVEIGALVIFLAWFTFLLQMMRISYVGIFVVMFMQVFRTVTKCLGVFSVIFVAFALSLHVLYRIPEWDLFARMPASEREKFGICFEAYNFVNERLKREDHVEENAAFLAYSTAQESLFHILYLMMGEYDNNAGVFTPLNDDDPTTMHFPVVTVIIMIAFILTVPILLVNLLIGLAVGDIDKVRKNASIQLIGQQVNWLNALEPKFPRSLFDKIYLAKWIQRPRVLFRTTTVAKSNLDQSIDKVKREDFDALSRTLTGVQKCLDRQTNLIRVILSRMDIGNESLEDERDVGVELKVHAGYEPDRKTNSSWM